MTDSNQDTNEGRCIYWIGGSKGGVGKSMMTLATVDYLVGRGDRVLLVDCDTSNPDVWKAYREQVPTECINLDDADGWILLVNTCDTHRDHTIVINTAARNNLAVKRFGQTLDGSIEELGSRLIALWVINRQRDSLDLLTEFMATLPKALVHVVLNGYFGDAHKFELYNSSKVRDTVRAGGGKSVLLPDLADRVADDLYTKRLTIEAAGKSLPIGNRAELARWRSEVSRTLAQVVS
jgi:hypothetical protein